MAKVGMVAMKGKNNNKKSKSLKFRRGLLEKNQKTWRNLSNQNDYPELVKKSNTTWTLNLLYKL